MSSTVGSPTSTCWNRRSSAGSFSMCSRYSSSVVAPTMRSSPRASIGLSMLPASIARVAGGAGADDGVQLVDERDDLAVGVLDLVEHGLEPLLELAAVLRAGHHRAEVERDQPLAAQRLRHVAGHDALGQPLDDGGLADAGLADEHRVVLGTPATAPGRRGGSRLSRPMTGSSLPVARRGGEVDAVLLQRLVGALRVGRRDPGRAAHLREAPRAAPRRRARIGQERPRPAHSRCQADQQVLGGDVLVSDRAGLLLRQVEHLEEGPRQRRCLHRPARRGRQRRGQRLGWRSRCRRRMRRPPPAAAASTCPAARAWR